MPIIKRNSIRFDDRTGTDGPAPASPSARCAPTVGARLLRADGVVRAIEVTCACGEITVLELEYADAAPDRPPTDRESSSS